MEMTINEFCSRFLSGEFNTRSHLEKGSHGCDHAHWELYDRNVGFETPIVNGTWNDVKKYFLNA